MFACIILGSLAIITKDEKPVIFLFMLLLGNALLNKVFFRNCSANKSSALTKDAVF